VIHRHPSWGPCPCGVEHAAVPTPPLPARAPLPVRLRVWLVVFLGCLGVWAVVVWIAARLIGLAW
jgi:hypothetical protein